MSEELFSAVKTIDLLKRMKSNPQTLLQSVKHNRLAWCATPSTWCAALCRRFRRSA